MPDFTALAPESHRDISAGFVETLIQARREELFTGLMRLRYPSNEKLVFIFLEGRQQQLYRCIDDTFHVVPRRSWFHALDNPNASVGFLALPVEALRCVRVAYEAPITRVETSSLTRQDLMAAAGTWSAQQDPCIVHVQRETINKYYFISGHAVPIIEELSFGEGQARFSIGNVAFPLSLPEIDYGVTRYVSNGEHAVWREYELRLAFNPLLRMLMSRFGELAGRALTERLCEQLSLWAREQGWNITVTSNGTINRHYFDSLEAAVTAYLELIERFREETSQAIGSRMVDGISREFLTFDPYRRQLLTQYIYLQYGMGSVAGVVRR